MKCFSLKQLFVAMVALLCSVAATAHNFEVDGIYYNVTDETNLTVEVTFKGTSYSAFTDEYTGSVVIPSSVNYNEKDYSVTSIGGYAFYDCSGLTSITIPNSVTSIGSCTFSSCRGLTNVTIGNSVTSIGYYAFSYCYGLTSITIPNSVTSIGSYAFYSCYNLTSVTIPNSVTSIGNYTFYDTAWYDNQPDGVVYAGKILYKYKGTMPEGTSIVIKDGTLSIAESAFRDCSGLTSITIPNSVTSIGSYAFSSCSGLTNVTIGNSVTSIGYYAFSYCYGLTNVTIGNSVTSIGDYAFSSCYNLTSITIPNSVTSIGSSTFDGTAWYNNQPDGVVYAGKVLYKYKGTMPGGTSIIIKDGTLAITAYAFEYCRGLTSIEIPNSITSIGSKAFYECRRLTSVTIPNGVTSIEWEAFYGCSSLTSVTIPNSVTSIEQSAFDGCSGLTSVAIPNSVTYIGRGAFSSCSGLTSVTIPNSVTNIGNSAFSGCSGLTNVTIGDSVTSIENYAFYNCTNLTSITIPSSVTTIGDCVFDGCSKLTNITSNISADKLFAVKTGYSGVFYGIDKSNCTLTVPAGAKATYAATAGWNEFTNIVEMAGDLVMEVPYIKTIPGSNLVIPVNMQNEQEITALQLDVYLPNGITVATDDEGEPMITIAGDRKTSSHVVVSSQLSDGGMRIAVYSNSNKPFRGNKGTILNITTKVSDAMAIGDYTLTMKNIRLADTAENEYITKEKSTKISVTLLRGDANNDFTVSISDVVATVNYILEKSTKVFNFAAADINNDKDISVADIVGIVNIILNPVATTDNGYNAKRGAVASNGDRMSIDGVSTDSGNVSIPVSLENTTAYTAFQMDVELPEGATFASATLGSRAASNHSVTWSNVGDNKVRVVAYSLNNAVFKGATGELLTLDVQAADGVNGTVAVDNVRMVTADGVETAIGGCGTTIDGNGTTGVNATSADATVKVNGNSIIIAGANNSCVKVYSASGALVEKIDSYAGEEITLGNGVYVVHVGERVIKIKL